MRFWTWLLARMLVALLLVGWVYSALLLPSSGDKEFRRSLEALKKVNSIHYSMLADLPAQHTEQEADLVCSEDSFHRTTHIVAHQAEKDFNLDTEILRSGGQDYRLQGNGLWRREYSGTEAATLTCRRLSQGLAAWIVPDMNEMLQHGIIEKGNKKTVNGDVCREWKVTLSIGVILEHRTVCIGADDHLPREVVADMNTARWTYAFNTPIKIDPPTNLAPEPERDTYRPPPPGLTLSDHNDDN